MLYTRYNKLPYNRFAITFPKGTKGAVKRNRAKRIVREIIRINKERMNRGYDIVIKMRQLDASYRDQKKVIEALLKQARIILK